MLCCAGCKSEVDGWGSKLFRCLFVRPPELSTNEDELLIRKPHAEYFRWGRHSHYERCRVFDCTELPDLEKIHIILARLAEDTPFFILLFIICEWKTEIIWLLICVFTIPNDKLAAGCRECLSFPQKYVKSFFGFFAGDDICFDNGKLWSYKGDRANQNFENSCKALR